MPWISTGKVENSPEYRTPSRSSISKSGANAPAFSVGFGCVGFSRRRLRGNYLVDIPVSQKLYRCL